MKDQLDLERLLELLSEIQGKLKAPALNGGFDTLMYKVEKIEEGQEKILERISVLNEAVYDPDKGLFARIKDAESSNDEELQKLEKNINQLQVKYDSESRDISELLAVAEKREDQIRELENSVESLMKWKNSVVSGFKWLVVTVATTGFGVLSKIAHEYFTK